MDSMDDFTSGNSFQKRVILSGVLEAKELTLPAKLIQPVKTQSETTTPKPLWNQRRKTLASSFASQTSLPMNLPVGGGHPLASEEY